MTAVGIPLVLSFVLGAVTSGIVYYISELFEWNPPAPRSIVIGGLMTAYWLWRCLSAWLTAAYPKEAAPKVYAQETVEAAPPQPEPRKPINVYYTNEAGYQAARHYYLPVTDRQLELLARGLLVEAKPFSERAWAGKYRPFSITEFEALRDEMVTRQLAEWKDTDARQLGLRLTAEGHRIMEQVLAPSPDGANA
jgi:hypothetical protein